MLGGAGFFRRFVLANASIMASQDSRDVPGSDEAGAVDVTEWWNDPVNWVDSERFKADASDILIDIDYSLGLIGIQHRNMELADAYYMIQKYNDQNKQSGGPDGEE